MILEHF